MATASHTDLEHPNQISVMNPRRREDIKARQAVAGRFGFILGCTAAVAAAGINLYRAPRPWSLVTIAVALLMAALNVPLGIAFGLLGERFTRPPEDGGGDR